MKNAVYLSDNYLKSVEMSTDNFPICTKDLAIELSNHIFLNGDYADLELDTFKVYEDVFIALSDPDTKISLTVKGNYLISLHIKFDDATDLKDVSIKLNSNGNGYYISYGDRLVEEYFSAGDFSLCLNGYDLSLDDCDYYEDCDYDDFDWD